MIKCNNFLCFLIDTKYDNKKNVKNNYFNLLYKYFLYL